jgi:S1-C subfamily serine protease
MISWKDLGAETVWIMAGTCACLRGLCLRGRAGSVNRSRRDNTFNALWPNPRIAAYLAAEIWTTEKPDLMTRLFGLIWLVLIGLTQAARAQPAPDDVWVQIAARPTLESATADARIFAGSLPDVNGFALQGGWYAITLGPYTRADAEAVLASFRQRGLIPSDSYIAVSRSYGAPFWPPQDNAADDIERAALPAAPNVPVPEVAPPAPPSSVAETGADTETPQEARRSEALLSGAERRDLQVALQWAGVYDGAIDGAFGAGTRSAMADWQQRNGIEPTGVLTTNQRAVLMGRYNAILDGLDMAVVRDAAAGIEIRMPTALLAFSRHDAPFAHYEAVDGSPVRVLLISQQGSRDTLASLYEVMQTLSMVPPEGPRRLDGDSFTIVGRDGRIVSETQVERIGDEIKGFTLVWPVGDEARRARVMQAMQASFLRLPGTLDPTAGLDVDRGIDLFAGLDIRTPRLSRSGFYVDASGAVITTADAVQSCTRITLDDGFDAALADIDTEKGIAILKPTTRLAPPAVARFSPAPPLPQSEVAIAGYSFEGRLEAPSMTFGTLSDLGGLGGEPGFSRLSVDALPGDAGGPVMDASGNVLGMLLPQPGGSRQLPPEVRFALTSDAIIAALERAGLTASNGASGGLLDPVDITDRALGMTVLVSCWE